MRVSSAEETLLGPAFVGERLLWVTTSVNVTDEVWKEYIKKQNLPEPDDGFHVV